MIYNIAIKRVWFLWASLIILFVFFNANGQTWPIDTIKTNINTGDPAFPFPQFKEYDFGKSLAKYNGVGVTHADMEKAMREGYQIMMHRSLYVPGKALNGKKYIIYNHQSVPENNNTFVSEGDGYALLAAAYFADKETFDGLWLWIHDNRLSNVKKYYNCQDLRPNYPHGSYLPGWKNTETTYDGSGDNDSATDGDYDIAMGLLLAYKQWGEFMGIKDACGNNISYKDEALRTIKALVDTVYYTKNYLGAAAGTKGFLTGDIGIDGYCKNGNTWNEITGWRYSLNNTNYTWARPKPDPMSQKVLYTDYIGPAYFNQFAKFLKIEGGTKWQISQFKRGEASSDWMMGRLNSLGYIASSGLVSLDDDGGNIKFGQHPIGPDGEDFRASWRTVLNYVWHGNPDSTWNPVTHELVNIPNTFERDMGINHANFLKYPSKTPNSKANAQCSVLGASPDLSCPLWRGVVQIRQGHNVDGSIGGGAGGPGRTNFNVGTGTVSAVASEDIDLTAELYRQCEILWDDVSKKASGLTDNQRYIQSTPIYFHDWFRLLGMLTASGNLHSPQKMLPGANMKVYMSVDKTFAYEGDILTYTVSYRNYGSVAATDVSINTLIDANYEIVSVSDNGISGSNSITWNLGTIPGFQTSSGITPTQGMLTFRVKVKKLTDKIRVCLTSIVSSNNSESWTSNEYPNNATYTMERNCVDLLKDRSLNIKKTTDRPEMNSGDIVNFKLEFENKTGSDLYLNGGRDRVVLSYANHYPTNGTSFYQFYRIWHTGHESYINLGNYRVSYFMNDVAAIGKYDKVTNPTGWDTYIDNQSDLDKYGYNPKSLPLDKQLKFSYQKIPWGSDTYGSWNQRVITQFAHVLSAPSSHIYDKLDHMDYIHKGVVGPGFTRTRFESKPSSVLQNRLIDDWSYDPNVKTIAGNPLDGQTDRFFPISPTYTNSANNFAPVVINNYSKDICNPDVPNFERVLVEEFDGYTWRRIAGKGPLPGRETYNVVVTDSIPKELTFKAFTDEIALNKKATYVPLVGNSKFSGYVKWVVDTMLVGEKGDLSYSTTANSPCTEKSFVNTGWIRSNVDSPLSSSVDLKLSCFPVPPTPPIETSLIKTVSKLNVSVGDLLTYTLTFTNKDGSKATWIPNTALDWQTYGTNTTMPDMTNDIFTLNNNDNVTKPGANGYAFGHKKSHGKNGYTELVFSNDREGTFSLFFRYLSGTPGQSDFKGVRLEIFPSNENVINFKVYDGTVLIADLTNISYPGTIPVKIKAQLIDDKLYIWVNDKEDGAPLKVISGITTKTAGYAGIYTTNASQKISSYSTYWDSAFDLVLSDAIPSQLTGVTNISNSGTITTGTITWPIISGPILANDVIVRTFDAKVNTCADFITNIGKASVYGINNIQSQVVVTCGVPVACVPPASVMVSASMSMLCPGDAFSLTGTATAANGNYHYTWYKRGTIPGLASKTNSPFGKTAVTVGDSGTYILRVEDGNAGLSTCYRENSVRIAVNPVPSISDTTLAAVCSGVGFELLPTGNSKNKVPAGTTYTWTASTGTGLSGGSDNAKGASSISDTLFNAGTAAATATYTVTPMAGSCAGTAFRVTVPIIPSLTPKVDLGDAERKICLGEQLVLTGKATGVVGTPSYQWKKNGTDITGETSLSYATTTALDNESYVLELTSVDACANPRTVRDTVVVKFTTLARPSVEIRAGQDTLCEGEQVGFKAIPDLGGTGPEYQWYVNGVPFGALSIVDTVTIPSLKENDIIRVEMQSKSTCASPKTADTTYTVRVRSRKIPSIMIFVDKDSICVGDSIKLTAVPTNGGISPRYEWTDANGNVLGSTTVPIFVTKPTTSGTVGVKLTSSEGCVTKATADTTSKTVTVLPIPDPKVSVTGDKASVCSGDTVRFTATADKDGGNQPMYKWYVEGVEQVGETAAVFSTTIAKSGDLVWAELYSSERCAAKTGVASIKVPTTVIQGIDAGKVGDDQEICHNATPKNLVQTQAAGNLTGTPDYSWSTSQDNQNWTADTQKGQDYDFGSKTYTATTYFKRTVSDPAAPGACNKAEVVVKVTVYAPQEAGAIASPQELCEGRAISPLTDSVPASGGKAGTYTYTWEQSISPTGPFVQLTGAANAPTYTSTALLSETTYYRRKVGSKDKQGNSCATDSSNVVEVKVRKNKDISVTLNDTVACQGRTAKYIARIVANGGTNPTYKWYYDNELQTSTTGEFSSNTLANGKTVRVEVTSDEQCTSPGGNVGIASSTTNIVSEFSPEVTLLAVRDTCQGGSSTVTIDTYPASPNNTYEWYLNGSAVSTTNAIGIEGDSYVASGLKLGDNRVRVKVTLDPASPVAQCANRMDTVSQEATIRVYAYPTPVIRGGDTTICVGDTLSYRVRNGGGQITWYRDGKLLANNADSTLRVREGGSYHAVGASGGGLCRVSTDTVLVKAIPVPVAKAGIDKPYALDGEVVTLLGSGGGLYSWSPSGLLSDAKAQGPTFVAKRDTVFTLTVTDSSGLCWSRDSVRVFVERPIVIVNTFTPNGDGVNDRWVIRNIESFPRCLVKIYNRWGNLVWESTGYSIPWDGTSMHNGRELPDGTYFYIIELHSTIFRNPFQGWVQVIR